MVPGPPSSVVPFHLPGGAANQQQQAHIKSPVWYYDVSEEMEEISDGDGGRRWEKDIRIVAANGVWVKVNNDCV